MPRFDNKSIENYVELFTLHACFICGGLNSQREVEKTCS